MLRLDVLNYAENPSFIEPQIVKTPVQYIGLVTYAGKASLRATLIEAEKDLSKLKFLVGDVSEKQNLIELLAKLGLDAGLKPVIHLIECYKPMENSTAKDIYDCISRAELIYSVRLDFHVTKAPATMISSPAASLRSNSMFTEIKQSPDNDESIQAEEQKQVHHNTCCTIL